MVLVIVQLWPSAGIVIPLLNNNELVFFFRLHSMTSSNIESVFFLKKEGSVQFKQWLSGCIKFTNSHLCVYTVLQANCQYDDENINYIRHVN